VEVSRSAVLENARAVARTAGTRLLPVVKANGYGVGAIAVARALEALDPWGFGVATVREGAELREAQIDRPVLVFSPASPEAFDDYHRYRLTPVLETAEAIRVWGGGGSFHLGIDTGMSRAGVRWDEVAALADLLDTPRLEGCYTQFHSADRRDGSADEQLDRFLGAVAGLKRRPPLLHVANSAAALRDRRFALDMVRPGVYLYGGAPAEWIPGGRPVVSIRARVVSVRTVRRGETVSYNATWAAPRDTVVATLGIGYADGMRRALGLSGAAYVLLNGARCPVVGLVTMDYVMVETAGTAVAVGDVATLVGESRGGRITLEQFTAWSGELQREFLTGLGARLPRLYE
jgi:alanine racemase